MDQTNEMHAAYSHDAQARDRIFERVFPIKKEANACETDAFRGIKLKRALGVL